MLTSISASFFAKSNTCTLSLAILNCVNFDTCNQWRWSLPRSFDSIILCTDISVSWWSFSIASDLALKLQAKSETDLTATDNYRLWHLLFMWTSVLASFRQSRSFPTTSLDFVSFFVRDSMPDKGTSFSFVSLRSCRAACPSCCIRAPWSESLSLNNELNNCPCVCVFVPLQIIMRTLFRLIICTFCYDISFKCWIFQNPMVFLLRFLASMEFLRM